MKLAKVTSSQMFEFIVARFCVILHVLKITESTVVAFFLLLSTITFTSRESKYIYCSDL